MRVPAARIPRFIQTGLTLIRRSGGYYDKQKGGQWVEGSSEEIPFKAAFLPVTSGDLEVAQAKGWDTAVEKKIYTNGMVLHAGERVRDSGGNEYLITNENDHEYAGIVKIYFCKRGGKAGE